jgi:ribosome biogenesis GTPase
MNLSDLGWDSFWQDRHQQFGADGLVPARVAREEKLAYLVLCEEGELTAELSGKFRHSATSGGDLPAVGDWVAIKARPDESKATVHAVLPRKSSFSRKVTGGRTEEQVVAANIDTVLLVSGLDGGRSLNLRRIERYLAVAWDSGADPVIVLNKADVCDDVDACLEEVEAIALGTPVHAVSAVSRQGLDGLEQYLTGGATVALLGLSGVGKTTLINTLLGTDLAVCEVREDDRRGRHTTTHRELIVEPGRGIVIDTPGMRELQLWGNEEGLGVTFEDIESLAAQCRFSDCGHGTEPGCAVQQALDDGTLESARWQSYVKLQKELHYLGRRQDHKARVIESEKWKKIAVAKRALTKDIQRRKGPK